VAAALLFVGRPSSSTLVGTDMSLITIILGAGAAFVVVAQLAIAVWYKRRFGTVLRASARPKFGGDVPIDQMVIVGMFVLGVLIGLAAPVLWPDGAFSQWLREPYATGVYFAWCWVGMFLLNFLRAVAIVLRKKGVT